MAERHSLVYRRVDGGARLQTTEEMRTTHRNEGAEASAKVRGRRGDGLSCTIVYAGELTRIHCDTDIADADSSADLQDTSPVPA